MSNDQLKLVGVMEKGYGIIPKLVMKDKDLSVEAKAIYAYFCSYAGAGNTAFPSVELICSDLNMSDKRFRRHREVLVEKGYLKIHRYRTDNGFSKNIYTLPQEIISVSGQNVSVQNVPVQSVSVQNVSVQNDSTNNNSLNNNSLNNNKETKTTDYNNESLSSPEFKKAIELYENLIPGGVTSIVGDKIDDDLKTYGIDLMEKAFEVAALRNKRFYGYIRGILKIWHHEGVRTAKDLEIKEKEKRSQNAPDQEEKNLYEGYDFGF